MKRVVKRYASEYELTIISALKSKRIKRYLNSFSQVASLLKSNVRVYRVELREYYALPHIALTQEGACNVNDASLMSSRSFIMV